MLQIFDVQFIVMFVNSTEFYVIITNIYIASTQFTVPVVNFSGISFFYNSMLLSLFSFHFFLCFLNNLILYVDIYVLTWLRVLSQYIDNIIMFCLFKHNFESNLLLLYTYSRKFVCLFVPYAFPNESCDFDET